MRIKEKQQGTFRSDEQTTSPIIPAEEIDLHKYTCELSNFMEKSVYWICLQVGPE